MSQVAPGRLDFRIVLQTDWWVTRDGQVLELIQLTHPHVRNIIAMLQEMAMLLHLWAIASALADPGTPRQPRPQRADTPVTTPDPVASASGTDPTVSGA